MGQGYGPELGYLAQHGYHVRAVDLWYHRQDIPAGVGDPLIEFNRRWGKHLVPGSVFKLPFESGSIDLILANRLLNNLSSWKNTLALDEMVRVLKPGGQIRVDVIKTYDSMDMFMSIQMEARILKSTWADRGIDVEYHADERYYSLTKRR